MRSGFEQRQRRGEGLDAENMRAIGAGARGKLRMAVEDQCDIAPLHRGRDRLDAGEQRALVAGREADSTAATSPAASAPRAAGGTPRAPRAPG